MLLWMCLIFFYSSRPASLSAKDSGRIGMWIGRTFVPDFDKWTQERQQEFAGQIDHPVRKAAHAGEYAVLGFLTAGVCARGKGESSLKGKSGGRRKAADFARTLLLPWAIASAYAATDEFHQLFVPGRSGQVSDVLLDSAGVLAGVLVFIVASRSKHVVRFYG